MRGANFCEQCNEQGSKDWRFRGQCVWLEYSPKSTALLLERKQANKPGADGMETVTRRAPGAHSMGIIYSFQSLSLKGSIHGDISLGAKELTNTVSLSSSQQNTKPSMGSSAAWALDA